MRRVFGGILKVFSKSRSWNILKIIIIKISLNNTCLLKMMEKPEGCAGENPVLPDDRVRGEDVEAPGVDVQQDPLQLLLDEERIRERHWEDPLI